MSNNEVIQAWVNGRVAASRHLTTDGKSLFSYQMEIGRTTEQDGRILRQVLNVRAPHFCKMTTSKHVGMAERASKQVGGITELVTPVPAESRGSIPWFLFPVSPVVLPSVSDAVTMLETLRQIAAVTDDYESPLVLRGLARQTLTDLGL